MRIRAPSIFLLLALAACERAGDPPAVPVPALPAPAEATPGAAAGDPPGGDPGAAATRAAPDALPPGAARLRGRVAYPSEYLPPMRVCAVATGDPGLGFCTETAENAPHFDLVLPAGRWWLLAWPQGTGTTGEPGLLSQASECLGSGGIGCDGHDLLELTLAPGEVREGLDINDWYYDPGTEPPPMAPRGETLE